MKAWTNKIKSYFFINESGKSVINSKRIKYGFALLIGATTFIQLLIPEDDSLLTKSFKPLDAQEKTPESHKPTDAENLVNAHDNEEKNQPRGTKQRKVNPMKLTYNARQVFERIEAQGLMTPIPSGTNFVGKLINGIDTRIENQVLKVLLPYGGTHPSGGKIPRDSVLLGSASYSGGDRVYIRFNHVVYPNGQEYRIDAQALSSGDYTPGLIGNHHSETDLRVIGSLALTMVSAGADVLTQRTMYGANAYGMGMNQPNPTMENATLQGVSEVTKQEAERIGNKAKNKEEYLTVSTGGDLIVSLLTPFKGELFQ